MIGYILLISFGLVLSLLVYQVLKSYIPKQSLKCDEGVSISLNDISCFLDASGNHTLLMNVRNNGRFNISGYFIHARTNASEKLATTDLSNFLDVTHTASVPDQKNVSNSILFFPSPLAPAQSEPTAFTNLQKIYSITLIPFRYQNYTVRNNKQTLVVCKNAKITREVNCS